MPDTTPAEPRRRIPEAFATAGDPKPPKPDTDTPGNKNDETTKDPTTKPSGVPRKKLLMWAVPAVGVVAGVAMYRASPTLFAIVFGLAFFLILGTLLHRWWNTRSGSGRVKVPRRASIPRSARAPRQSLLSRLPRFTAGSGRAASGSSRGSRGGVPGARGAGGRPAIAARGRSGTSGSSGRKWWNPTTWRVQGSKPGTGQAKPSSSRDSGTSTGDATRGGSRLSWLRKRAESAPTRTGPTGSGGASGSSSSRTTKTNSPSNPAQGGGAGERKSRWPFRRNNSTGTSRTGRRPDLSGATGVKGSTPPPGTPKKNGAGASSWSGKLRDRIRRPRRTQSSGGAGSPAVDVSGREPKPRRWRKRQTADTPPSDRTALPETKHAKTKPTQAKRVTNRNHDSGVEKKKTNKLAKEVGPLDDSGFPLVEKPKEAPAKKKPQTEDIPVDDAGFPAHIPTTQKVTTMADVSQYTSKVDNSTPATLKTTLTEAGNEARSDSARLTEEAAELRKNAAGLADKPGMVAARGGLLKEAAAKELDAQNRSAMAAAFHDKAASVTA